MAAKRGKSEEASGSAPVGVDSLNLEALREMARDLRSTFHNQVEGAALRARYKRLTLDAEANGKRGGLLPLSHGAVVPAGYNVGMKVARVPKNVLREDLCKPELWAVVKDGCVGADFIFVLGSTFTALLLMRASKRTAAQVSELLYNDVGPKLLADEVLPEHYFIEEEEVRGLHVVYREVPGIDTYRKRIGGEGFLSRSQAIDCAASDAANRNPQQQATHFHDEG